MADFLPIPEDTSAWSMFRFGADDQLPEEVKLSQNRLQGMFNDTALNVGDGRYQRVFKDPGIGPLEKASYAAGRVAHDVVYDGTRIPYWVLNHPMAATTFGADFFAGDAGVRPDYAAMQKEMLARESGLEERLLQNKESLGKVKQDLADTQYQSQRIGINDVEGRIALGQREVQLSQAEQELKTEGAELREQSKNLQQAGPINRARIDREFARREGFSHQGEGDGIPLSLARKVPALAASTALLATSGNHDFGNVANGGRIPGFESIMPSEHDDRISSNPLAEMGARYLFGRTGKLLDWDEFTQERPGVTRQEYEAYKAYMFDKGPLFGLLKGTTRNIDQEPEARMMGFRVPLSSAAAVAGGVAGGITAANALANAEDVPVFQEQFKSMPRGSKRVTGYLLGSAGGAIAGNLASKAVNAGIIQPIINPEAVANSENWVAQQRAQGLM